MISQLNPLRGAAVVFALVFGLLLVAWIVAPAIAWTLMEETGVVENAGPFFWFVAALVAVAAAVRRSGDRLELSMLAILFVALGFRELDLHKETFGWSITRFINYTKSAIPLGERLAAFFLILTPLAIAAAVLLIRGGRRLIAAAREKKRWPVWTAWWFILLFAAFGADKLSGFAAEEGDARGIGWYVLVSLEETLETVLALYSLLLMIRAWAGSSAHRRRLDQHT